MPRSAEAISANVRAYNERRRLVYLDPPAHAAVDWSTLRFGERCEVKVTCPVCGDQRFTGASPVLHRIRTGVFTGRCKLDTRIGVRLKPSSVIVHPQVDWQDTRYLANGRKHRLRYVAIVCPKCDGRRYQQACSIEAYITSGTFSGICRPCRDAGMVVGEGRTFLGGYVVLHRSAVSPADLWLFDGTASAGNPKHVYEHRLVMAKVLGRPLNANELVDHRDGQHGNNEPDNLRLYVRGKQEPGSAPGHGTYYHEWQLALARVRELEAHAAFFGAASSLSSRDTS